MSQLFNSYSQENFLYSPLEQFEVLDLLTLSTPILGDLNISITNLALYSMLVGVIVAGVHFIADNETRLIPSKWSIALESSFASINSMVREQIGILNESYFPFIYSLFFFVLIGNLISNIPYSFSITASAIVCLGSSVTIFLGVTILALYLHRISFFSFFIPGGTPLALTYLLVLIELVSYLARAVSLGVRLLSNLIAGHILIKILSTFIFKLFSNSLIVAVLTLIPFSIFIGLLGLELAVSLIQAFVFCLLVCSYLKDAIQLH